MVDYETMYKVLFTGISDAIQDIEQQNYGYAKDMLIKTQEIAEEIFIETGEIKQKIMRFKVLNEKATKLRSCN